jgi:hypothetical protein
MPYSDFTLEKAIERLGVRLDEQEDLFASILPVEPSDDLKKDLERDSLFSTNSEKARSEIYIVPILSEVFSAVRPRRFSIFSGENFDVDAKLSLKGIADYLICITPTKLVIQAPVIAIAESKRNDPVDGLGQCLAELYAAALFNERKNRPLPRLFGMSTNGFEWIFGTYEVESRTFYHDSERYALQNLPRILGILSYMRDEALKMDARQ